MRTPMVAGNWKMNKGLYETRDLIREMIPALHDVEEVEVVICPPFVGLGVARRELDGSTIKLGAQNMHWADSGAFTGEISPVILKELCEYVILGHSERRAMFGETDETVNKKVLAALAHGLKPIVCVGETLEENQGGITAEVVSRQVRADLEGLTQEQAEQIVIAYEPVWAIGTGLAATPEGANAVHKDVIRPILREMFGEEIGDGMRILYGGSVNPGNAEELFGQSDIDGGLIGGASLKAESFIALVKAAM
ncbi:MAG TPA: triose-phosphate isomerase [Anaerolineaceae bacterium]|nr:triose-phosphate isomerase [Anaerolineaceae bacterium]